MESVKVQESGTDDDIVPSKRQKLDNDEIVENGKTQDSQNTLINNTEEYSFDDEIQTLISENTLPYPLVEQNENDRTAKTPPLLLDKSADHDSDGSKPCLEKKIESVYRDAELISSILSGIDVAYVYEKLKARRKDPNRVDIIMNEILEKSNKVTNAAEKTEKEIACNKNQNASLLEDFVKVIDKSVTNVTSLPVTADEIHKMLERYQNRSDRVDYVVSLILVKHFRAKLGRKIEKSEETMKEFMLVSSKLKDEVESNKINPDEIFQLLEDRKDSPNRVDQVVDHLKAQVTGKLEKADSFPNDPALRNDPLYRDMRIVSKVVKDKDPNEIYAYLEAHHDKKDRIRVVIEELLKLDPESQSVPSFQSHSSSFTDFDHNVKRPKIAYGIKDEVDEILEIFPDCDPNYLYEELEKRSDDQERVRNLVMDMFDNKKYPKMKENMAELEKVNAKRKLENLRFTVEEFLLKFSDPKEAFCNDEKLMNENYKTHATVYVRNRFKNLKDMYLKKVLQKHNYHMLTTVREIETELPSFNPTSKKFKFIHRIYDESFPEEPDEFFFHEKYFYEHEIEINEYLEDQERNRKCKLEEARKNGELLECECCFDDECLAEDILSCNDGHLFCKECICRSSAVVVGQGKCEFPCLTGTCEYPFSLAVLQSVLSPNMFSIVLRRMQEEEIKQANLDDLVSCPFCSFSTIMSNPDDKVFKCLNPECLKDSCRLCKEPNHIPLRCNEVEKQGETSMRTYIETKLSEAMLRTCHKCNKRFYKESGCNKMTCVCGASMCYVCRETDIDYDHFTGQNQRCSEENNMVKLHWDEMLEAAESAKQQYLKDHPEALEINLKYDPVKHLEEFKKLHGDMNDDYEEDDYNDNDDYDD